MEWAKQCTTFKVFLFVLKVLGFLLCLAGFFIQMSNIWSEFQGQITSISIEYQDHESLALPAISICPIKGTKIPLNKITATEEEFNNETYKREDLILESNAEKSSWNFVRQVQAPIPGRCYTFNNAEQVGPLDINQKFLLNGNHSLNVYVHPPGDEFWLWLLLSPVGLSSVSVSRPVEEISSMDLHIKKRQRKLYERETNCKSYSMEEFTQCGKEVIEREALSTITCVSHMVTEIVHPDKHSLPVCENEADRTQLNTHIQNAILKFTLNMTRMGCPLPCTTTYYDVRVNYFDEFASDSTYGAGTLWMYTYFDSMTVEVQAEILIYDWPKFLSAIGGTLSLYLGFSCLSLLLLLLKVAEDKKK